MNKRLGYFIFSALWLVEVYLISLDWDTFAQVSPLYWVLVALATVTISHTISFYGVGDWFRAPMVKEVKDSAGGLSGLEAKEGPWQVIGELVCCPICSGTHGATLMLLVFSFNEKMGWALAAAAALSSVNMLLHWLSEKWQWEGRLAVERQGTIWLRKNYGDLKPLTDRWLDKVSDDGYHPEYGYVDGLTDRELAALGLVAMDKDR